jgi:hypothetical protein
LKVVGKIGVVIYLLLIAAESGADDPYDDESAPQHCGDPLPNTYEHFCAGSLLVLANSLNPYGTESPDDLRERFATHSICAICQCGVEPISPESDANQLANIREFLAVSPQKRLDLAAKAGDLRFLGVPDFVGMYVPCYGHHASADLLKVVPQTLNVQLSEEHAELNRRVYEYARQYNYLLGNWLVCSEDIPLPEASRQRLGIRCAERDRL